MSQKKGYSFYHFQLKVYVYNQLKVHVMWKLFSSLFFIHNSGSICFFRTQARCFSMLHRKKNLTICLDKLEQCVLKARHRQRSVISRVGTGRWTDQRNTLKGPRIRVKCSLFFANFKQYWIRTAAMKIGLVVDRDDVLRQ